MFIDRDIEKVDIKKLESSVKNIDTRIEEVQNLIEITESGTSIFEFYSHREYNNLEREKNKEGRPSDTYNTLIETQSLVSDLIDHDKMKKRLTKVLNALKKAKKDITRNMHCYGILKTIRCPEQQEDMRNVFMKQNELENV